MFNVEDYVVDYQRINELTVSDNDSTDDTSLYGRVFTKSISRSGIKNYMKSFETLISTRSDLSKLKESQKHIINTLIYNRILVNINVEKRENILEQLLD